MNDELTPTNDHTTLGRLFMSFLKIGLFTFGGGYAMIPLIEQEVVDRNGWVGKQEFIDLLTIAQSAPGPIALNSAAFVGYKSRGYIGAISALTGIVLPSFLIILVVAIGFASIRENAIVEAAFKAMRPVVVALILNPTISLMKGMPKVMIGVMILSMVLFVVLELSPIYLIGLAIVAALIWTHRINQKTHDTK